MAKIVPGGTMDELITAINKYNQTPWTSHQLATVLQSIMPYGDITQVEFTETEYKLVARTRQVRQAKFEAAIVDLMKKTNKLPFGWRI